MHSSSVPLVFASSAGIILSRTCSSTSFRYRIFSSSMPSSCVHYAFPTLRLRWSSLARSLPACSRCALLLWFTSVPSSLFKQCHFSGHQHCLFAALDETFISMLSVMLSPMQCVPHPNGQATVRSALTVVCGAPAHTTIPVGGSLVLSSTFIPKCSYRRGAVFTQRLGHVPSGWDADHSYRTCSWQQRVANYLLAGFVLATTTTTTTTMSSRPPSRPMERTFRSRAPNPITSHSEPRSLHHVMLLL